MLTAKYAGKSMGRCLTRRIKGWKFPQNDGSSPPIRFPFKP